MLTDAYPRLRPTGDLGRSSGRARPTRLLTKFWCAAAMTAVLLSAVGATAVSASASDMSATAASGVWRSFSYLAKARKQQPRRISPASAFILPSGQACVRGRTLILDLRDLPGITWRTLNVYINGRRVKTVKRAELIKPVKLTGLPSKKFSLSITARTTDGRAVTATRAYKPCAVSEARPPHRLSVTLAGSGSGSVSGSGIACPGTCSRTFPAGTVVTLIASPASGSSFTGWSGTGCAGTGACNVTLSSDRAVTANFAVNPAPTHTLSVTLAGSGSGGVSGSGIACPGTCSHIFPAGTVVALTASPASGSSFVGWSGGGCGGTGTCIVTLSADQSVSASFTVNGSSSVAPGSYSGSSSQSFALSIYVAADSSQIEDVVVPTGLQCAPSKTFDDQLEFASIPINADGSFTGTATQAGVLFGAAAQFTYSFSGRFTGTSVAGQLREDITFNNGTAFSCTTNALTWSASRDTQGTQTASPPPPGSYSGSSSQSFALSLHVSADSSQIQDVVVPTGLQCAPSQTFDDQLEFASIPINADGSFSGTATQTGVLFSATAHFTYTLAGHFHGTNASGVERVGGQLREDITFNNGTAFSCTTNVETWLATRDTQGSEVSPPPPGSYSGSSSQSFALSLHVSADSSHIQDVVVPTGLQCLPGKTFDDQLEFASIPINADGSFSATATQAGVLFGATAQFSYTLAGHFHGTNASGVERVGGQLREDITFNNGTAFSCTTNVETWLATRDTQGSEVSPPPPGSYSGSSSQSFALSMYVAADSSQIEDVVVPTGLQCAPSKTFDDQLEFASIPINADGSFSGMTTQAGVLFGATAQFSYTLAGHFHGTTASGVERVGGQLREDITFNDGTAFSCTTNIETWSATRDTQGAQTASPPPPGSYSGSSSQSFALSLTVSASSTQIQNLTVPTGLQCVPARTFDDQLQFASIAINADGSFSATTGQSGVVSGEPAQFTYTLAGHFHGTTASGAERVGGQLREDITLNNGTAFSCTTNVQTWSATGP